MGGSIDQTRPLLFILGPSGVGKSSFGQWLAAERNWLHLEIDRYPDGDGIDLNSLRSEWDEFYTRKKPERLTEVISKRLQPNEVGAALTFPGISFLIWSMSGPPLVPEFGRAIYTAQPPTALWRSSSESRRPEET